MKNKLINSVVIMLVVLTTVAFTNSKKEVKTSESTINWTGEKVTGSHEGTIQLESGYLMMEDDKITGGEFVMDMSTITVTDLSGEGKEKLEGHLKSATEKVSKNKTATKKATKKTTIKKAAKKTTTKKAAKKIAKKAAKKKTHASVKKTAEISHEQISQAAYLNYISRTAEGIHGDHAGDWLAAETSLRNTQK